MFESIKLHTNPIRGWMNVRKMMLAMRLAMIAGFRSLAEEIIRGLKMPLANLELNYLQSQWSIV